MIARLPRTVVVLGDLVDGSNRPVVSRWARARGYPLIAEPFGRYVADAALPHGPLLLTASPWLDAHAPQRILVVGRVTLSRAVTQFLRRGDLVVEAITDTIAAPDPAGVVTAVHSFAELIDDAAEALGTGGGADLAWGAAWAAAGERLAAASTASPAQWGTGLGAAAVIAAALPAGATLLVGASNPVRDLDLGVGRFKEGSTVVANRGLAGIDGTIATAIGVALAGGPSYAVMGDLTFIHDSNALAIGPGEPRPDLTVIVVNDDGGGIFTLLEPGEPQRNPPFERLFGTPTGTNLAALCRAHGVAHARVGSPAQLHAELAAVPSGLRVVDVPIVRGGHRAAHQALRALAAAALADAH